VTQWDPSLDADAGDYGGGGDLQLDAFGEHAAL
jgi:adhesin HecA-like repeat protein